MYGSRTLSESERNYSAYKREFLALKWAIVDKFRDYLYGRKFTAVTDSNPLTSAKLSPRDHGWLAALAPFDFDILYRPGECNSDADGFSRLPHTTDVVEDSQEDRVRPLLSRTRPISKESQVCCPAASFQAMCAYHGINQDDTHVNGQWTPAVETTSISLEVVTDVVQTVNNPKATSSPCMDSVAWRKYQDADPSLSRCFPYLLRGKPPTCKELKNEPPDATRLLYQWDRLVLHNSVLYRRVTIDQQDVTQLVIPFQWRDRILRGLHDDMGHLGRDKTLETVFRRF